MSPETLREIENQLRDLRQAFNNQDLKTFRGFFWTNPRFLHLDPSGRLDQGWGAFEEVLDQEFRYLDRVQLTFRNPQIQVFEERFATITTEWSLLQVDPTGEERESGGRASFSMVRFGKDWKIVMAHYSSLEGVPD